LFVISSLVLWTVSIPGVKGLVTKSSHQQQATALPFETFARKQRKTVGRLQAGLSREDEIRRKIALLKRQGKIQNKQPSPSEPGTQTPVAEQYGSQVRKKLGSKKAQLLGQTVSIDGLEDVDEDDDIMAELDQEEEISTSISSREARLGPLPREVEEEEQGSKSSYTRPFGSSSSNQKEYKNFDVSLFEDDEEEEDELSDQDLLELVAAKMQEKQQQVQTDKDAKQGDDARKRIAQLERERQELRQGQQLTGGRTTTGIGGSWSKSDQTSSQAGYKPSKSGTWGVFERPKDISSAFGGGKRVGAGYTPDDINKQKSEEDTRARLREYREKVGIEVQSEKDHAAEIDEALAIARRAMEVRCASCCCDLSVTWT
jgi:hypothetical protein